MFIVYSGIVTNKYSLTHVQLIGKLDTSSLFTILTNAAGGWKVELYHTESICISYLFWEFLVFMLIFGIYCENHRFFLKEKNLWIYPDYKVGIFKIAVKLVP